MITRRGFIGSIVGLGSVSSSESPVWELCSSPVWVDVACCLPLVKKLYSYSMGSNQAMFRSDNVLCKNHCIVFMGYLVREQNDRLVWYQDPDHSREFPMAVDQWMEIDANPDQLHRELYEKPLI